jgi:hypothetical protein
MHSSTILLALYLAIALSTAYSQAWLSETILRYSECSSFLETCQPTKSGKSLTRLLPRPSNVSPLTLTLLPLQPVHHTSAPSAPRSVHTPSTRVAPARTRSPASSLAPAAQQLPPPWLPPPPLAAAMILRPRRRRPPAPWLLPYLPP